MNKNLLKRILFFIGVPVAFIILSFVSYAIYDSVMYGETDDSLSDSYDDSSCTVMGINLHGTMLTYVPDGMRGEEEEDAATEDVVGSEEVVSAIMSADDDPNIKAVLLEIDSYGGAPVAGEEIANALKALSKPSVAVIRQSGTSAAYLAATGADRIFASKNSDVGSIGVTMSYLEESDPNKKYVQLSSGKYKDAGDPDKPLTADEKELLLRDVRIVHENFIEAVATNRNIPVPDVKAIADGSSMLGDKALSLKLIDEIGSWTEAENYLEQQIGEKPVVCW